MKVTLRTCDFDLSGNKSAFWILDPVCCDNWGINVGYSIAIPMGTIPLGEFPLGNIIQAQVEERG